MYALPAAVVGSQVDDLADVVSGKTQPGWAGKLMVATGRAACSSSSSASARCPRG